MKVLRFPLMLIMAVLLLNACNKDDDSIVVNTLEVSDIGSHTATLNGEVASNETPITGRGFFWSETNENPGETDNKIVVEGTTGSFSTELSDLESETKYYLRAYASDLKKVFYGQTVEFTTAYGIVTETAVVDVTNPVTGKTWMDRNLGASRAATSSTDSKSYGDLYQWGRADDGHQKRNSSTSSTLSKTDSVGHDSFILTNYVPNDWRSPQNHNLWQGLNGVNNPCPSGYRLPTETEWNAERQSWSSNNSAGAFASPLKLPLAGVRRYSHGEIYDVDITGSYWSSDIDYGYSQLLTFDSSNASIGYSYRTSGYSVRCIKD